MRAQLLIQEHPNESEATHEVVVAKSVGAIFKSRRDGFVIKQI
jgi:hypothetical protein